MIGWAHVLKTVRSVNVFGAVACMIVVVVVSNNSCDSCGGTENQGFEYELDPRIAILFAHFSQHTYLGPVLLPHTPLAPRIRR